VGEGEGAAMSIHYRDGYKYQLDEDHIKQTPFVGMAFRIDGYGELRQDGLLHIFRGYAWNGASGPTVDTEETIAPSAEHDFLYQGIESGRLPESMRNEVDDFFHRRLLECGMKKRPWMRFRAWTWRKFVGAFGGSHAARKPRRVLSAPS
jgi:hypothetical protein